MKISPNLEQFTNRLKELISRYPDGKSAIMPGLYLGQEAIGYISDEVINWVAENVNVAPIHVREVATFYTMFRKKPCGKYNIQVCRTLPCMLRGAAEIVDFIKSELSIDLNEVTKDGMFSVEEVECLGSCGTAPMFEINDTFFENLTTEKVKEIIESIRKFNPDLSLSTNDETLGAGLEGWPKSEVINMLQK